MDSMPPINRVFSLVNGQKPFGRGIGGSSYQGRGRGNGRVCSFCERIGHTVDTCYKKHGYPHLILVEEVEMHMQI